MSELYRRPGLTDPFAVNVSKAERRAHFSRLSLPANFRQASDEEVDAHRLQLLKKKVTTTDVMGPNSIRQYSRDKLNPNFEYIQR